jgi:two-component system cell cycle response regulator
LDDSIQPTLTIMSGTEVGRVFTLSMGRHTIGRQAQASIQIAHESISRRHTEVLVRPGGRTFVRDLQSTNGTKINETPIQNTSIEVMPGDRIRLSKTVVVQFEMKDALEREVQEDLYSSAIRDGLTGVYNKRFLQDRAEQEVAYAGRHNTLLSIVIFDLDHFKQVNDSYGHPAGDQVLIEVAQRVHNALRAEDILARIGGEEFAILMRGTSRREAMLAAERIRESVASSPIVHEGRPISVTLSLGVATLLKGASTPSASSFLAQADALLYQAKEQGRNRTVGQTSG